MRASIVAFGLALILGCATPTSQSSGRLLIESAPSAVQLTNQSSTPIYILVVERGFAARIDWHPCTDPTSCEGIEAGATRSIPYLEIDGYTGSETEAIVYWWHLIRSSEGGLKPDEVRAEIVRF